MPPVISGHGGEFELIEPTPDTSANLISKSVESTEATPPPSIPTIDFTIPPGVSKFELVYTSSPNENTQIDDHQDVYGEPPEGHPPEIKHPNDHVTKRVKLELSRINDHPYEEAIGHFKMLDKEGEKMNFEIRHYTRDATDQIITLAMPDPPQAPAVKFGFDARKGDYVAVVLYNFRELPRTDPEHKVIMLNTGTGLKDEADRPCYVYITMARDEEGFRNPQSPDHQQEPPEGATLEINVHQVALMMENPDTKIDNGNEETLYYIEASQIDSTNLNFENRVLIMNAVTKQENTNIIDTKGVVFKVPSEVSPVTSPKFPLGLYVVAEAPSVESPPDPPPETPAKTNINTASAADLDALPNIGPTLAARIIAKRQFTSIEEIKSVNGIGQATFEDLKELIIV